MSISKSCLVHLTLEFSFLLMVKILYKGNSQFIIMITNMAFLAHQRRPCLIFGRSLDIADSKVFGKVYGFLKFFLVPNLSVLLASQYEAHLAWQDNGFPFVCEGIHRSSFPIDSEFQLQIAIWAFKCLGPVHSRATGKKAH